jgi:hypothetical protein
VSAQLGASLPTGSCGQSSTLCRIISTDFRSADPLRVCVGLWDHWCSAPVYGLIVPSDRRPFFTLMFLPPHQLVRQTWYCRLRSCASLFPDFRTALPLFGGSVRERSRVSSCFILLLCFPFPRSLISTVDRASFLPISYIVAYSTMVSKTDNSM